MAAALVLACGASAQSPPNSKPDQRADAIGREARQAGAARDYPRARDLFRKQLELTPEDFQARYNLARAEAALNETDAALADLRLAIENGFDDLRRIRRDALLAPVRERPQFVALNASWDQVLDAQRDANIERSKAFAPKDARVITDEKLRLVFISAWDPQVLDQARDELARLTRWAEASVFPDLLNAEESRLDPWVVIVLPDKEGFDRWQTFYFGARPMNTGSFAAVGGAYDHDTKRLVARDLGSTLRHEFFHVLHWRSTTRLGQIHPVWLQEGLCSLVEDFDADGDKLTPTPSYRTNTTRRLLKIGSLLSISDLVALDREKFLGNRPMASYAQARTLFLYLFDHKSLGTWYGAYCQAVAHADAHANPAQLAISAFELSLQKPIADIEKDYRQFVRTLPDVAEQLTAGAASLGVQVEPGTGDGPIVVAITRTDGVGLRIGDVVLSVDGRPTRDTPELVRVLSSPLQGAAGGYSPGDHALVKVRRDGAILQVPLVLVAR